MLDAKGCHDTRRNHGDRQSDGVEHLEATGPTPWQQPWCLKVRQGDTSLRPSFTIATRARPIRLKPGQCQSRTVSEVSRRARGVVFLEATGNFLVPYVVPSLRVCFP